MVKARADRKKIRKARTINKNGYAAEFPKEIHEITKELWDNTQRDKKKTHKTGERQLLLQPTDNHPPTWTRVAWRR
jgi:hypothetical protein